MAADSRPLVLHLRATNFVGGPEKQILQHAAHMQDSPFRVALATFDEGDTPSSLHIAAQNAGFECHRLTSIPRLPLGSVLPLTRLLASLNASALVTHGYKPNILGRMACWRTNTPNIAVSRGWTHESARIRAYEALDKLMLRYATKVVAVSHGQKDKILKAGICPGKVQVIHNAINLADIPDKPDGMPERERLGVPGDAILIGTAGRLSPEKNHLGLIEAAAEIVRVRDDVYFVVWGEGFLRPTLKQAIVDKGLSGRFLLPGFSKTVVSHFHELDVFVLPSHTEGLSNVLLEAFACCKPAVATAVGGNPEVVEHGTNGLLTPQGDSMALTKAILQLTDDPQARIDMGRAGRMRVEETFDFISQTEKYLQLYETVTSAKRQAA